MEHSVDQCPDKRGSTVDVTIYGILAKSRITIRT